MDNDWEWKLRQDEIIQLLAEQKQERQSKQETGEIKYTTKLEEASQLLDTDEDIHRKGLKDFYHLRKTWSNWIIGWVTALIAFNVSLTILIIITSWFDSKDYKWFINTVTIETFLQIVGLGYIAVHFLFSDGKGKRKE